jgi:hypothetical protein
LGVWTKVKTSFFPAEPVGKAEKKEVLVFRELLN